MAGINIMGSYSGIDPKSIDGLMEIEKLPLVALAAKKTDITGKQNAWKDVNTRLNSLFEKMKALKSKDTFASKLAKSTNEDIVSMSAGKNAASGTYRIHVSNLATNTSVVGLKLETESIDTELNKSGSFTIKNEDGVQAEINVETTDSLKSLVAKVNEKTKDTGISASIIDKRIVLNDTKTGARGITLDGVVLSDIGLGINSSTTSGSKANFTINGIPIESDSNTVTGVVENITINLKNVHSGLETETLTVSLDTSETEKAIKAFVDQYNSTMTFIEDKLAAGTPDAPATRGTLAGDSTLQRLHSSLRSLVTSPISNSNTSLKDISQIGVTTIDRFGQLIFDPTKLKEELANDPLNVQNFFNGKDLEGKDIGFATKLGDFVDSIISKTNGVIKGKNESFERSLKDVGRQIENFNARVERKKAYYTKMFSALDVAMMQAESQMEWLNGQVTAMNAQSGANRR